MMHQVRKNLQTIMWILILLIVPTFVLWGVGSTSRSGQGPAYAGILSGHRVSWERYRKSWIACRNQLFFAYGASYQTVLDTLDLEQEAWTRLVLLEEAKRRGIRISDENVRATVLALPSFQQEGIFQKDLYENWIVRILKTTPRDFEEELRDSLALEALRQQVTAGVVVEEDAIRQAFRNRHGRLRLILAQQPIQTLATDFEFKDEEVQDWYAQHAHAFLTPGRLNASYISFLFENYEAQADGDDEEAKKEQGKDLARADSEKAFAELIQAEDPAQYALESGLLIQETGLVDENASSLVSIGPSFRFLQLAQDLEPGQISDPIETANGIFIIMDILEHKLPETPPLEGVRDTVLSRMAEEKGKEEALKAARKTRATLEAQVAAGKPFLDTAQDEGLEIIETGWIKRTDEIPGIGRDFRLMQSVFELEEQTVSEVLETRDHLVIVWVDAYEALDEEKLSEQREALKNELESREAATFYNRWIQGLLSNARLTSFVEDAG